MSLRSLLTQEATVVSFPFGPTTDEYGNLVAGPESRVAYPARLEDMTSAEANLDRDTVVADLRVFLPPEAVIGPYDRVEIDGEVFEVVGRPLRQRSPRGVHHVEAALRVAR